MAQYKVKCPHCGNWTLSEINRSTMSKGVRGALKKGGMKGVLTAAGTVVPGFGNVAGFVTGKFTTFLTPCVTDPMCKTYSDYP